MHMDQVANSEPIKTGTGVSAVLPARPIEIFSITTRLVEYLGSALPEQNDARIRTGEFQIQRRREQVHICGPAGEKSICIYLMETDCGGDRNKQIRIGLPVYYTNLRTGELHFKDTQIIFNKELPVIVSSEPSALISETSKAFGLVHIKDLETITAELGKFFSAVLEIAA